MDMRDKIIGDRQYFKRYLQEVEGTISQTIEDLHVGQFPESNLPFVKYGLFKLSLERLIGLYSSGVPLDVVQVEYYNVLVMMSEAWDKSWTSS